MGIHATAYLAYGIPLGEEEIPPNTAEEEWEELLEEWDNDVIAKRGFEIVQHCHYDYPMYFLAVPGTRMIAWQGDPTKIRYLATPNTANWGQAMQKLGLDVTEQGWYMMSDFG